MPWFAINQAFLNSLIVIGVCLSVAAIVFLVKAAKQKEWGNAAMVSAILLIAVFGWIFSLQQGYLALQTGNPKLEITSQIDEVSGQSVYFACVVVLNRGSGTARNCVMQIEYRSANDAEYKFLGYSPYEKQNFTPYTQSHFCFLLARSSDEGIHWDSVIKLQEIRDYVERKGILLDVGEWPIIPGDYYLRLTMIAENTESSPCEFKLHVSQDGTELPKLEALCQTEVQPEH